MNDLIKVLIWIPKLAFTIDIQHQTFAYISQKIITNVVRCIICFLLKNHHVHKSVCVCVREGERERERERERSQMPQNLMHPIYLRVGYVGRSIYLILSEGFLVWEDGEEGESLSNMGHHRHIIGNFFFYVSFQVIMK